MLGKLFNICNHLAVGIGNAIGKINLIILELKLVLERIAVGMDWHFVGQYFIVERFLCKTYICYPLVPLFPIFIFVFKRFQWKYIGLHQSFIKSARLRNVTYVQFYFLQFMPIFDAEIKPLKMSSCIGIYAQK